MGPRSGARGVGPSRAGGGVEILRLALATRIGQVGPRGGGSGRVGPSRAEWGRLGLSGVWRGLGHALGQLNYSKTRPLLQG